MAWMPRNMNSQINGSQRVARQIAGWLMLPRYAAAGLNWERRLFALPTGSSFRILEYNTRFKKLVPDAIRLRIVPTCARRFAESDPALNFFLRQ